MGKVHDALEKVKRNKDMGIIEPSKPPQSEDTKSDYAVLKAAITQHRQEHEKVLLDPSLVAYHGNTSSVEAEIFRILRTNIPLSRKLVNRLGPSW